MNHCSGLDCSYYTDLVDKISLVHFLADCMEFFCPLFNLRFISRQEKLSTLTMSKDKLHWTCSKIKVFLDSTSFQTTII